MARTVTLKEDMIVDSWTTLIDSGFGKAALIFQRTEQLLAASEAPDVEWERVEAQPGRLKGLLLGKKRDYLRVINKGAGENYRMYIGARDFGKHLDVTWFLTVEPNWLKNLAKGAAVGAASLVTAGIAGAVAGPLMGLDIFDQQDLRAYVTVAHHCLLQAVKLVMEELGQDPAAIDRKSKGVLQVW